MLLHDVATHDELVRRAERLRGAVGDSPIVYGDVRVELTISVGCALASDDSPTLDALLDTADSCLYAAKHEGRDRVSLLPSSEDPGASTAEPEAVGLARALAFASSLREGSRRTRRAGGTTGRLTAEHLGLPARAVQRAGSPVG